MDYDAIEFYSDEELRIEMNPKERFDKLVKGLESANNTYLHDETLKVVLEHVAGTRRTDYVVQHTMLLESICFNKKINVALLIHRSSS